MKIIKITAVSVAALILASGISFVSMAAVEKTEIRPDSKTPESDWKFLDVEKMKTSSSSWLEKKRDKKGNTIVQSNDWDIFREHFKDGAPDGEIRSGVYGVTLREDTPSDVKEGVGRYGKSIDGKKFIIQNAQGLIKDEKLLMKLTSRRAIWDRTSPFYGYGSASVNWKSVESPHNGPFGEGRVNLDEFYFGNRVYSRGEGWERVLDTKTGKKIMEHDPKAGTLSIHDPRAAFDTLAVLSQDKPETPVEFSLTKNDEVMHRLKELGLQVVVMPNDQLLHVKMTAGEAANHFVENDWIWDYFRDINIEDKLFEDRSYDPETGKFKRK